MSIPEYPLAPTPQKKKKRITLKSIYPSAAQVLKVGGTAFEFTLLDGCCTMDISAPFKASSWKQICKMKRLKLVILHEYALDQQYALFLKSLPMIGVEKLLQRSLSTKWARDRRQVEQNVIRRRAWCPSIFDRVFFFYMELSLSLRSAGVSPKTPRTTYCLKDLYLPSQEFSATRPVKLSVSPTGTGKFVNNRHKIEK